MHKLITRWLTIIILLKYLTEKPITGLTLTDATAGKESHRYHVVAVDALGQEGQEKAEPEGVGKE